MALISRSPHRRAALLLSLLAPLGAVSPATAEPRDPWPSRVHAVYRIDFNGFEIGAFDFDASISGHTYSLRADAQISALLGAFKWRAITQSAGTVVTDMPRPAGYTFDFSSTVKSGSVKMGFAGDAIASLTHVPALEPQPNTVPVRDSHLKSVLDPLSAVMALSRSANENPCGRKLAIFDGKQRFDLTLSYKRQEAIAETRPSGQPGVAFVCRVRYQPIAGHKTGEETSALATSNEIEVSLRPVPSANLFIPHQITIPTGAGSATLTSTRVDITTPRNEQIALSY